MDSLRSPLTPDVRQRPRAEITRPSASIQPSHHHSEWGSVSHGPGPYALPRVPLGHLALEPSSPVRRTAPSPDRGFSCLFTSVCRKIPCFAQPCQCGARMSVPSAANLAPPKGTECRFFTTASTATLVSAITSVGRSHRWPFAFRRIPQLLSRTSRAVPSRSHHNGANQQPLPNPGVQWTRCARH